MKKRILLLFIASLLLTFAVSAQDPEKLRKIQERIERGQKATAALDAIANFSPSLNELRGEAGEMIIEAVKTNNPALIPHLKVLASDKDARSRMESVEFQDHIALAKLGDLDVLPEIFAELDTAYSPTQDAAIAKLAQIGSKEAYRKLHQLLDDITNRDDKVDDELIEPKAHQVMHELGKIFKDVPRKQNGVVLYDIPAWKAWFAKNKHLIE